MNNYQNTTAYLALLSLKRRETWFDSRNIITFCSTTCYGAVIKYDRCRQGYIDGSEQDWYPQRLNLPRIPRSRTISRRYSSLYIQAYVILDTRTLPGPHQWILKDSIVENKAINSQSSRQTFDIFIIEETVKHIWILMLIYICLYHICG